MSAREGVVTPTGSRAEEAEEEVGEGRRSAPRELHLRFLTRDEWLSLIPLKVLVQRVDGPMPKWGELYPTVAEGAFQLTLFGPDMGLLEVGEWSCLLCGERGEGLKARLEAFYKKHNPERLANVDGLCAQFGCGQEEELNVLLRKTYTADLSDLPDALAIGWGSALIRRVSPLTFVIENALGVDGDYAITFPAPYAKRAKFLRRLEGAVAEFATFRSEVSELELTRDSPVTPPSVGSPTAILNGFPKEYMESSVPERRGPLKQGEDGKSEYGVKISAGSHKMAQNIRGGSKWVSEKMVEGTKHLSEKLGPAASQAEIHPQVEKGLTLAKQGTEKLLEFTKDVLGGLGTLAAHGVNWTADKITSTEAYKEWEKKPEGPRSKALKEVAGSAVGAILTVGYGLRDGAHIIIEDGLRKSVVHASSARWGAEAGSAADKTCQAVINVHYAALNGAAFVEKGAKEVVGKVASLALLDAGTKATMLDDVKNSKIYKQGPLLHLEASGFGITLSLWTCFIAVLRERSLALYSLVDATDAHGGVGVRLIADGEEQRILIAEVEAGGGAARCGRLEAGDIIVGVDGKSVEKMSIAEVEAKLQGPVGTMVTLMVCNGKAMQRFVDAELRAKNARERDEDCSESKETSAAGTARKEEEAASGSKAEEEEEENGREREEEEEEEEEKPTRPAALHIAVARMAAPEAAQGSPLGHGTGHAACVHGHADSEQGGHAKKRSADNDDDNEDDDDDDDDDGELPALRVREKSQVPQSEDWTFFPVQSPSATSGSEASSSAPLLNPDGEDEKAKAWMYCDTPYGRGKLHRIITAQDMKGCVRSLHEGRVHALAVDAHSQKRGYIFQAASESEVDEWCAEVEACVERYDRAMAEIDFTIRMSAHKASAKSQPGTPTQASKALLPAEAGAGALPRSISLGQGSTLQ